MKYRAFRIGYAVGYYGAIAVLGAVAAMTLGLCVGALK